MEAKPERLDQMADAARQTAADVETLRASVAGLQARLEAVESHLTETQAAHTRTASELERVRHELAHFDRLDSRIDQLRDEMTEWFEAQEKGIQQALLELRHRVDTDAVRLSRELAPLTGRVRALEALPERMAAIARRQSELDGTYNTLDARIEALAPERQAIEELTRQSEHRLRARIEGLDQAIAALTPLIERWGERIEGQSEAVRQARALAEGMREEVSQLQRDQHEVAEAQRLWEGRINSVLEAHRTEAEEAWQRFLAERGHDWQRAAEQGNARDTRLDELADAMERTAATIRTVAHEMEEGFGEQAERVLELRRQLHASVSNWADSLGDLVRAVESGLPHDEQPSTVAEERQALRRSVRARRGKGES